MTDLTPEEQADKAAEAKSQYEQSIDDVTDEDVAAAAQAGKLKVRKLEKAIPKSLAALWGDLILLIAMIGDYTSGKYRTIPFRTIAAATGAVLYFVSPFDVIPDFLLGVGYMDDAAVLGVCLRLIHDDLAAYRKWKDDQSQSSNDSPTPES